MTPDQEARILMAFDHAVGQMKEHVRAEVVASESRMKDEIAKIKGVVLRIDGKVATQETACKLTHTTLDGTVASIKTDMSKLQEEARQSVDDELEDANTEIRRRDDERRKWAFWAIGFAATVILGSGGVVAALLKFVLHH